MGRGRHADRRRVRNLIPGDGEDVGRPIGVTARGIVGPVPSVPVLVSAGRVPIAPDEVDPGGDSSGSSLSSALMRNPVWLATSSQASCALRTASCNRQTKRRAPKH